MSMPSRPQRGGTPPRRRPGELGFTLPEMLMALLISGLIMIGVFAGFEMQNRTHNAQQQVTDMQQNLRAALSVMTEDIRMAGYDPHNLVFNEGDPAITTARLGKITFIRAGAREEGKDIVTEKRVITYRIAEEFDPKGWGVVTQEYDYPNKEFYKPENPPSLVRCELITPCDKATGNCKSNTVNVDSDCTGKWEQVARGVEGLEFVYLTSPDMKAKLTPELWREEKEATEEKRKNIRAVTITLLMRTDAEDQRLSPIGDLAQGSKQLHGKSRNSRTWTANIKKKDKDEKTGKDSPHRRRLLFTTVQMRNSNLVKP